MTKARPLLPENPNAFTRSPLDRAAHRRSDAAFLQNEIDEDQASVIVFHKDRVFCVQSGPKLLLRHLAGHVHASLGAPGGPLVFLGLGLGERAVFACELERGDEFDHLGEWWDVRQAAARLEPGELASVGCAKAILEWHAKNQFCANCGARSDIVEAGWKRVCPSCAREHFPRVDPVCIMLATKGDKCLLGRQSVWPRGMHSALAGFIEPGEAIEEAVARETLEEAGLRVTAVRVHSTQPWPFPHSLMIGAICDVENEDIIIDGNELESARWFTREEARQLLDGKHPDCFAPPPFAIAHQLLKSWVEEGA